jgi:hypothetical protein
MLPPGGGSLNRGVDSKALERIRQFSVAVRSQLQAPVVVGNRDLQPRSGCFQRLNPTVKLTHANVPKVIGRPPARH